MAEYDNRPDSGPDNEDKVSRVLSRFEITRFGDDHWMARCPAHEDDDPSLSISLQEDRILLHCFSGCETKDIVDAVDLSWGDLFLGEGSSPPRPRSKPELTEEERELRHAVYTDLLRVLTLSPQHRDDLRRRGLCDQAIDRRGYRSLDGLRPAQIEQFVFMHGLEKALRVPGFVPRVAPDPTMKHGPYDSASFAFDRGLLAPVRDASGRILTAQVRSYEPDGPKYLWLPRGGSPAHAPLGLPAECPEVRVTEGPLKADVACELDASVPTVGVGGVASWAAALPLLEQLKVKTVRVAFDADWQTNPSVEEQVMQFEDELSRAGYEVARESWPAEKGKGIDDLLASGEVPTPHPVYSGPSLSQGGTPDSPDSPDDPSGWGEPVMLGEIPAPPTFSLDTFPEPLVQFCRGVAEALPCPPDYVAVPMLVMAGAAVGASRALEIKPGYSQCAALYGAVVGPPGSTKSPALSLALAPAVEAERRAEKEWKKKIGVYLREKEAHELALKQWKADQSGARPSAPSAPVCDRVIVQDATTEAIAALLADNARGLALVQDELAGLMAGMNQYRAGGKGNDRQFFLSAWSHAPVTVDRRKDHDLGPLRVDRPFLAVLGGLTPDNLGLLLGDHARRKGPDDGFIDRVLFAWPTPLPASEETWRTVPDDATVAWGAAYRRLRELAMPAASEEGAAHGVAPSPMTLTKAARAVYQEFTRQQAQEVNGAGFPDHLRGPWSKLRGYWGRLALIIQLLRWSCGEAVDHEVDDESAGRASRLVAYFKGMARRVHAELTADPRIEPARKLWGWVVREGRAQFKAWEAHKDLQSQALFPTVDSLGPSLDLLTAHNLIRPLAPAPSKKPGRKPAIVYAVNPHGLRRENRENRATPRTALVAGEAAELPGPPGAP